MHIFISNKNVDKNSSINFSNSMTWYSFVQQFTAKNSNTLYLSEERAIHLKRLNIMNETHQIAVGLSIK